MKGFFDKTKFTGLPLTILSSIFLITLVLLIFIIKNFLNLSFFTNIDHVVNLFFYNIRQPLLIKFFHLATLLGETPIAITFTLIISLILWKKKYNWQAFLMWLVVIGSQAFTYTAKLIFHRPRPLTAIWLENTSSFPSGHATVAIALYGFLAYLTLQHLKNKQQKFLVIFISLIIILLLGFSRLYLGVHYVSDIAVGYLNGLLWLTIGIGLNEWQKYQKL